MQQLQGLDKDIHEDAMWPNTRTHDHRGLESNMVTQTSAPPVTEMWQKLVELQSILLYKATGASRMKGVELHHTLCN